MNKNIINDNNYTVSRVPTTMRFPFISVTLVYMGMLTALDQFMLGAILGHSMTLSHAFLSIFLGSLIFGFVTIGLGFAGMREGLSSSLLARWCGFGRLGSVICRHGDCSQFVRLVRCAKCCFRTGSQIPSLRL